MTLRARLTLSAALAVAVAVVLASVAVYFVVRSELRGSVDESLSGRAGVIGGPRRGPFAEDFPRVPFTWMRIGIAARLRRCSAYSAMPRPTISAMQRARNIGSGTRDESLAQRRPTGQGSRGEALAPASEGEAEDAVQQAGVGDAGGARGGREVLGRGHVRGRVRLDQLRVAVRGEP